MFTGTIDLAGDVNLRRCVDTDETCLDEVAEELARADVRLGNLEGAFSSDQSELFYKTGWYHGQPDMAKCLVGRFDAVGCANNVHHGNAIVESAGILDELGIGHSGAGRNLEDAHQPAVVSSGGGTVGLLAYTSVFEPSGHAATDDQPGVATIKGVTAYEPNPRVLHMPGAPALVHTWADSAELERACADVTALRSQVDVVVAYLHFGVSMSPDVHDYQQQIAHALIDAGASIVAGSHSHTLGPIESYGKGLIFYSLGNFVFNTGFHVNATKDGALAKVAVRDGELVRCALLPTYRPASARATFVDPSRDEGARIAEMIQTRCASMGTKVRVEGRELVLDR